MTPAAKPREHTTHFDDCGCQSAALKAELKRLRDVLELCEDYFDQRADADAVGDPQQYVGNTEMTLLSAIRRVLPPLKDWCTCNDEHTCEGHRA